MSAATDLLAKLRRNREIKCDLGDGLSVTFLRPTEREVAKMTVPIAGDETRYTIKVEDDAVRDAVISWQGFSEAAILGPEIGSSDAIDFDRDLWGELASDSRMWYFAVATKMLQAIIGHNEKQAAAAKNSVPG